MQYSAHFVERTAHYRELAKRTPNRWQAESQLGLANLFLEMSCDMRLRELTAEPARSKRNYGRALARRPPGCAAYAAPAEALKRLTRALLLSISACTDANVRGRRLSTAPTLEDAS